MEELRDLKDEKVDESSETKKMYFNVTGMTCASCSGTVERGVTQTAGVISCQVSLLTNTAAIVFRPQIITPEAIMSLVSDLGFEATIKQIIKGKSLLLSKFLLSSAQRDRIDLLLSKVPGILKVEIYDQTPSTDVKQVKNKKSIIDVELEMNKIGIRDIINLIKQDLGVVCTPYLMDGDLEARKRELQEKREKELAKYRRSFWQSMYFTVPVTFIAMVCPEIPVLHDWLECSVTNALTVQALLLLVLVFPVQFIIGRSFYISAYKSLKHGSASMDVLISLGSTAAYIYSLINVFFCILYPNYTGPVFFETSSMLISIVLLGRYIENIAKGKTSEALAALMSLQPSTATLIQVNEHGEEISSEEIDVNLVQYGDIIKVLRGDKFPADGVIVWGKTHVDESLITGESLLVPKKPNSQVIGATLNQDSPVHFRATSVGAETVLSKIITLVNEAQTSKAPIQAFADSVAKVFVPIVVAVAVLTAIVWYILLSTGVAPAEYRPEGNDNFVFAFMFGIAVLVISCPCSLGLATPTAVMVGTGVATKFGILFKGGQPLEVTGKINKVLFDKTGTLTQGKPSVNDDETITFQNKFNMTKHELWTLIGSAEMQSEHLLGKAICTFAKDRMQVETKEPSQFEAEAGAGIKATVGNRKVLIGNPRFLLANNVIMDDSIDEQMRKIEENGHMAVCAAIDGSICAIISIFDAIKPEARTVIQHLHHRGIEVYMVTGDNNRSASAVAEAVGIPSCNVIAQVNPAEKADAVIQLQEAHLSEEERQERVQMRERLRNDRRTGTSTPLPTQTNSKDNGPVIAFVGDGVNDSPALANASVGIAIGKGTDIAIETAQVILMREDLTTLLVAIDLSAATLTRIRWNFVWALIYNFFAIPFAAGVFYPLIHMRLPPWLAASAMGLSSISVIISSLLLKRYKERYYEQLDGVPIPNKTKVAHGGIFRAIRTESPPLQMRLLDSFDSESNMIELSAIHNTPKAASSSSSSSFSSSSSSSSSSTTITPTVSVVIETAPETKSKDEEIVEYRRVRHVSISGGATEDEEDEREESHLMNSEEQELLP